MVLILRVALLFTLCSAAAPRAVAEENTNARVKALYAEATAQYDLGEYGQALEKYKAAFLLRSDQAAFLFNIGQCYRQLGDPASAARSYRSYLRESHDATNKAAVEKLIAEMDRAIEEKRAAQPPTGTEPPRSEQVKQPQQPTVLVAQTVSAQAPGRQSRTGLWIGIGVGAGAVAVAAIVLSIVFGASQHPSSPTTTLGNFRVF